jgi:chromosome segregation ATPase
MARGGINKVHVQRARDAILARGNNPSIDAVRIELGNTGSKSTIHRYLKELEEAEPAQRRVLSDSLADLVSRLATQLQDEAGAVVNAAAEHHQDAIQQLTQRLQAKDAALQVAQRDIQTLDVALRESRNLHSEAVAREQQVQIQTQRFEQQVNDLQQQLADRDRHLQSLEEKHVHAREALTHYRDSVKEQREQDQRRHEQQVQQLQAEIRQLGQILSIKQSDITQLSKDNAQLVAELGASQKRLATTEHALQQQQLVQSQQQELLAERHTELQMALLKVADAEALKTQRDQMQAELRALEANLLRSQTELAVKDQLLTRWDNREVVKT